jgi:hypothetical protein
VSTPPSIAIAVPFAWTQDATYDVRLAFAAGASPVNVLVDNGTYRMNIAAAGADFLRKLATEINDALTAAGRAETCSVDIGTIGLITITCSAAATFTFTTTLRDALGLGATTYTTVTTLTGTAPPRDLYLFIGGESQGWQRREPIAASMTCAGSAYGVRSGIVSWEDSIALELIPSDPDARTLAGETATPWEAGTATLPWSCERLITTGLAVTVAFARHWQDVRSSTSELFDLVTIRPEALAKPDSVYQFPGLTTWRTWTLPLVRTSTDDRS